jgi:hypothetical protein
MIGSGFVIDGKRYKIPGINVINFMDDSRYLLKMQGPKADGYVRGNKGWLVRNTCLHTTEGKRPVIIHPGVGPNIGMDDRVARSWTRSAVQAGAHIVIDFDGSVVQCADLLTHATYHAGAASGRSIGIEISQTRKGETWEVEYDVAVATCDFISLAFDMQRFYQHPYDINEIARLHAGAGDVVGFYCHYHQTSNRGPGDCGPHMFERLHQAGYMPFNYNTGEDRKWGKHYQEFTLGFSKDEVDGVLGPASVRAIRAKGIPYGQLVSRPNDDEYARILGKTR